jgi:glucokinase-like ROK family protein
MKQPKRTIDIRRINRQVVLKHLYFDGPTTRIELSQRTGMSAGTVTNLTYDLLQNNIILETGSQQSEGGRPATLLAVNPHFGYIIGVDLGETHVQLELFDLTLCRRGMVRHLLAADENDPQIYVTVIAQGIEKLISQAAIRSSQVLGIGIGVPGVVERNHTVSISAPMWDWKNIPFQSMLEEKIAHPIYMDNGAKAMTLAESWFGAGKGVEDLVVLLIGTGIGAGIIAEGSLYRGATNSAGEWGHTKIVLDGRPCRCSNNGCLEAYAGAPGIQKTYREIVRARGKTGTLRTEENSQIAWINALFKAAAKNNPEALQTLQETAHYLGVGIANLINLFNPHKILIGGWVGMQLSEQVLKEIREHVSNNSLPAALRPIQIALCQLGQDAICMGAACLVLEDFIAEEGRLVFKTPAFLGIKG